MIGLHISDLFWRSLVVDPDAEAGNDTLDTDAGVDALADELAVIIVFVVAETGVFVDDGVLPAGVFYSYIFKCLATQPLKPSERGQHASSTVHRSASLSNYNVWVLRQQTFFWSVTDWQIYNNISLQWFDAIGWGRGKDPTNNNSHLSSVFSTYD